MRIGCPSGVGDVYWCLTKLQSFREKRQPKRVTLCIRESKFERASGWAEMVDFVDRTEIVKFSSSAEQSGYEEPANGLDCVMWPNAIVDQGKPLSTWLPEYDMDLNFPIRTAPGPSGAVVIYASNRKLNLTGFPRLGPRFWNVLARSLESVFGVPPTIIGASLDAEFSRLAKWPKQCVNLVDKTTLPEVAGIIQRAKVVIGVISGMTILANHFRVPTVALCQDKYHAEFPYTWVADDAPYSVLRAKSRPTPAMVVSEARLLVGKSL